MSDPAPMPVLDALKWAIETLEVAAQSEDSCPEDESAAASLHALADALPDGEPLRWVLEECPPTAKGPEYGLGMVAARAQIRRLARVLGGAPRS